MVPDASLPEAGAVLTRTLNLNALAEPTQVPGLATRQPVDQPAPPRNSPTLWLPLFAISALLFGVGGVLTSQLVWVQPSETGPSSAMVASETGVGEPAPAPAEIEQLGPTPGLAAPTPGAEPVTPAPVPQLKPRSTPAREPALPEAQPVAVAEVRPVPSPRVVIRPAPELAPEVTQEVPPPPPTVAVPTQIIRFVSRPLDARVLVDGVEKGSTPLVHLPMEEGIHRVRLELGDRWVEKTIEVGERQPIKYLWNVESESWEPGY